MPLATGIIRMKFKQGDLILVASDMSNPASLREYTVVSVSRDEVKTNAGIFYASFCFPARVKPQLVEFMTEQARLKKLAEDHFTNLYELRNKIIRGEL